MGHAGPPCAKPHMHQGQLHIFTHFAKPHMHQGHLHTFTQIYTYLHTFTSENVFAHQGARFRGSSAVSGAGVHGRSGQIHTKHARRQPGAQRHGQPRETRTQENDPMYVPPCPGAWTGFLHGMHLHCLRKRRCDAALAAAVPVATATQAASLNSRPRTSYIILYYIRFHCRCRPAVAAAVPVAAAVADLYAPSLPRRVDEIMSAIESWVARHTLGG